MKTIISLILWAVIAASVTYVATLNVYLAVGFIVVFGLISIINIVGGIFALTLTEDDIDGLDDEDYEKLNNYVPDDEKRQTVLNVAMALVQGFLVSFYITNAMWLLVIAGVYTISAIIHFIGFKRVSNLMKE